MLVLHPPGRRFDSLVGFLALAGAVGGLVLLDHWALSARLLVLGAACAWVAFNLWGRPPVVVLGPDGVTLRSWWGASLKMGWDQVQGVVVEPSDAEADTADWVDDYRMMEIAFVVHPRVVGALPRMRRSYFSLLAGPAAGAIELRAPVRVHDWAAHAAVLAALPTS